MTIDDIDLLADTWGQRVPHEEFDLLRAEDPVHWHPEPNDTGFWAVTRHADVVAVSRDPETYSSELGLPFVTPGHRGAGPDPPLDPRHGRRQAPSLPPAREQGLHPSLVIARLEEQIVERAAAIMDDVCERGECEFVEDVAAELRSR